MRRVGKIGRRKVFPEVKNVNVKSLKNGSKLLDFLEAYPNPSLKGRAFQKPTPNPSLKGRAFLSLPQPLPEGKGFSISPLMPINSLINCPINSVQFVNNSCSKNQFMVNS